MSERDKTNEFVPTLIRWTALAAVLFAVAGLVLTCGRLVLAGDPAEALPAGIHDPGAVNDTVYTATLPLVSAEYATWTSRGMIAFERRSESSENHDIYLMYNDGSGLENLTNNPDADDGAPTWSPDGRFIAFSSDRVGNGNRAIYKIDVQTREVVPLTNGDYKDRWPTWSPNGVRIAFQRKIFTNDHANQEIFVMNADGTNVQNITNHEWGDDAPAWSRDGAWIAFTSERFWGGRDLWIVDPDDPSDVRNVQRTDFQEEIFPSWSPNGQIYYTFNPTESADLLYRIQPDGSDREEVFADDYKRYIASFSPDGECFVFYGYMGGPDKEVWKWCQGFGAPVNLTDNTGISDEFCAWSPVP